MHRVSDINVVETAVLPAPELLLREVRRTEKQASFVAESRQRLHEIIFTEDRRFLLVIGPCSIHDIKAGRDYAQRLAALSKTVNDRIELVMRVYFEKPRTSIGWKGLIMDPHLDGSHDIFTGLRLARQFLGEVIDMGLPTATELLDPITPQYIADLICWSAIGARTTESQTHRQMASGLSMPLGFKNATSGSLPAAINAIKAASQPQTFLGISSQGLASAVTTRGNPNCHIILRGGESGTNYDSASIADARAQLEKNKLPPAIMVDCSHANSGKDYRRQPEVLRDIVRTLLNGQNAIIGSMVESNLVEGSQTLSNAADLKYGVSVTDPCIGWETTEALIKEIYTALEPRFASCTRAP
ncbi:MAG: 3-deoxy-7-phosphoheptulonate synthase [Verrucomicrobiota bacterium]|nr:3-deoxy-7-phosphoheptulonate synthase [Verrucomicrobiota bacterium]